MGKIENCTKIVVWCCAMETDKTLKYFPIVHFRRLILKINFKNYLITTRKKMIEIMQ